MNATNSIGTLKVRWPPAALNLGRAGAARPPAGVMPALFTMGFAAKPCRSQCIDRYE